MLWPLILKFIAWMLGLAAGLVFLYVLFRYLKKKLKKQTKKRLSVAFVLLALALGLHAFANNPLPAHFAMPPTMHSHAPGSLPASIPILSAVDFLSSFGDFEQVDDIGADPNAVPDPIDRDEPAVVDIEIVAKEVIGEVVDDQGIYFNYWTYNGQAPGPMFRVREGDTVNVSLTNDETSLHEHNIDFHAVTGPGGGGAVTKVQPGETKTFTWKSMNPGLYVYHCATANISTHNSHGQYGLILVEPEEGLPEVDHEFYIMQGELYTDSELGQTGLVTFDSQALLDGIPTYVTFNGKVESAPRMEAEVGDTIRMYVGNGGVNLISSFHVIGEIFDLVYPEAAMGSEPFQNVQTTAVLPGGATIVEFTLDYPGDYLLVDHALARMNKGAWAVLTVTGEADDSIFYSEELSEEHDML
jgi:nitrite reductase (NO-forming)